MSNEDKTQSSNISESVPQSIFERNLQAFVAFAKQRGAEVDENGSVVWEGVTLTHHIRWRIEGAGGDEEPVDPQKIWRELIFDRNESTWWKYLSDKGVRVGSDGWLCYKGVSVIRDKAECLRLQDGVFERLLTEEEFEALWENFLEIARVQTYKANLAEWELFLSRRGLYFDEFGWLTYEGKRLLKSTKEYLSQIDEVHERLLSEKEFEALLENLLSHNAVKR